MKVAVADDNTDMMEIICRQVMDWNPECECQGFTDGKELLGQAKKGQRYDLFLLDVEMPGTDGLTLAKKIRRWQSDACIVFLTAYRKYAFSSYDMGIRAYHYLLKDEMEKKLPTILSEIAGEKKAKEEDYYLIQNRQRYERIRIPDIQYLRKEGKNIIFVTESGEYKERKSLRETVNDIGKPEFLPFDHGYALNVKYIKKIEKNTVFLADGTELCASHVTIRKLRNQIDEYWRRRK